MKESPAMLSLGKMCEENPSGQTSNLTNNGRTIECKKNNHIPLVVPGVQDTEHQNQSSDRPETGTSWGDHERNVEAQ